MKNLRGLLVGTALLLGLGLALGSCNKEEIEEQCSCINFYEQQQTDTIINGVAQHYWEGYLELPVEGVDCDSDGSTYEYLGEYIRFKTICY